jgi:hypothetical protein
MSFRKFDRDRLKLKPLSERVHDMTLADVVHLDSDFIPCAGESIEYAAAAIADARSRDCPVIAMFGAHVIKRGCSLFLIDMIERAWITHLATNGAGAIHDFELALIGATTESVAVYIKDGQFGLWEETSRLNDIAKAAAKQGIGFGEALGREIAQGQYPHKAVSVFAAAHRLKLPITVHVSIGQDIVHEHPNCDGAAWGAASYTDFLIFAESVRSLPGGVFCNIGTQVAGPEVFLKALAMARNVAGTEHGAQSTEHGARSTEPRNFTTVVFDLVRVERSESSGEGDARPATRDPRRAKSNYDEPDKSEPEYYFRPLKTLLVRAVQDGGTGLYIRGDHRSTIPSLHRLLGEKLG